MAIKITGLVARDIRFPTSRTRAGSDALHAAPDYSAAYVVLETDGAAELAGHGLTFTAGRGNEVCVAAIRALEPLVVGRTLESITAEMVPFWRSLASDGQLRWIGPEKGAIHMATAAVVNAVWDLYAKVEGKPLWKLVVDMTPERVVSCVDFRYITDELTPEQALDILRRNAPTRTVRESEMFRDGYPAYTTSVGWLGYDDDQVRRLCREAVAAGWSAFKVKVGGRSGR
jgi:L-fuconate dehydratase